MSDTPLRVVAAAVMTADGVIHSMPPPARHHNIIHAMHMARMPEATFIEAHGEQGFLLSDGTFAGRVRAGLLAIAARQIAQLQYPPRLYSEDLW